MKSWLALVIALAIAGLALTHPTYALGDGSLTIEGVSGLGQNATAWSPELAGGQWSWRLSKYKSFEAAYKLDGQTFFLLSSDPWKPTDSVLWNPLTGIGVHIDQYDYTKFKLEHRDDWVSTSVFPVHLNGGKLLQSVQSPARAWRNCQNVAFTYYRLLDADQSLITEFYLVRRLAAPQIVKYFTCPEAQTEVEHSMTVDYLLDFWFASDLSDGTLIFLSYDARGSLLMARIDQSMTRHSFLDGEIVAVDGICSTRREDGCPL